MEWSGEEKEEEGLKKRELRLDLSLPLGREGRPSEMVERSAGRWTEMRRRPTAGARDGDGRGERVER